MNKRRIIAVISEKKITYTDGSLNLQAFKQIALLFSDLNNSGNDICLVTAGAISMGTQFLKIKQRPQNLSEKQAIAAVGQVELVKTYQDLFSDYGHNVAQVLLTRSNMTKPQHSKNIKASIEELLKMDFIPVVNENDSVSTDDIELEDNYPLATRLATIIDANAILLASDIQDKFHLVRSGTKHCDTANNLSELYELVETIDITKKGNFNEFRHELILNPEKL